MRLCYSRFSDIQEVALNQLNNPNRYDCLLAHLALIKWKSSLQVLYN
jgi:hypothetical protein